MKIDIEKLRKKAGIAKYTTGFTCWEGQLERFADLVAAAEREACAKVCEAVVPFGPELALQKATIKDCAAAIRARGQA